jgi:hypothetical protein
MLRKVLWAMGACAFIALLPATAQAGERVYERSYSHSESSYTRIVERTSSGCARVSRCAEPRPCDAGVPYRCERRDDRECRSVTPPCRRDYSQDRYPVEEQSRYSNRDDYDEERYQPRERVYVQPQYRGSYKENYRDRDYDDDRYDRRPRRERRPAD